MSGPPHPSSGLHPPRSSHPPGQDRHPNGWLPPLDVIRHRNSEREYLAIHVMSFRALRPSHLAISAKVNRSESDNRRQVFVPQQQLLIYQPRQLPMSAQKIVSGGLSFPLWDGLNPAPLQNLLGNRTGAVSWPRLDSAPWIRRGQCFPYQIVPT